MILLHLYIYGKFNYYSYLYVCSLLLCFNRENERRMLTIKSNQVGISEEEEEERMNKLIDKWVMRVDMACLLIILYTFSIQQCLLNLNEKSTDNLRIVFWLICVLIKLDTQFIFDKNKFSYLSNLMNSDCLENIDKINVFIRISLLLLELIINSNINIENDVYFI